MNRALLWSILAVSTAASPPAEPVKPHPLPDDRDNACRDSCYMFGAARCTGRCRVQLQAEAQRRREMDQYTCHPLSQEEQEARAARLAERLASETRLKAEREAARVARDAAERLARTPAKTLRRRAKLAASAKRTP